MSHDDRPFATGSPTAAAAPASDSPASDSSANDSVPAVGPDESVEARMLSALELFHYESRFRNQLFVVALEPQASLTSIITDLRVLQPSDIRVVVLGLASPELPAELDRWNSRGCRFALIELPLDAPIDDPIKQAIRERLRGNRIPILALTSAEQKSRATAARLIAQQSLSVADFLRAMKVFFLSTFRGLEVDGVFQSHPSFEDVGRFLEPGHSINIGREQLQFLYDEGRRRKTEVVLLDAKSGSLFQEIFTHRGRGTLFTKEYPNIVRRGELSDVTDIAFLMKPSIASGAILPMSEDAIAEHVAEFFVYTINGALVASAWLVDYGAWAEAAKICTLPRFQGKGRARQLVLKIVEEAKALGKEGVFSLSIEPKMWQFFESLGFHEIDRTELPADWRSRYDLSRPSRAFLFRLR